MNKTKTNISVKTNTGSRRKVDVIAGDNGPYVSGDILDANATKQLVDNVADSVGAIIDMAPENFDTLKEAADAITSLLNSVPTKEEVNTIKATIPNIAVVNLEMEDLNTSTSPYTIINQDKISQVCDLMDAGTVVFGTFPNSGAVIPAIWAVGWTSPTQASLYVSGFSPLTQSTNPFGSWIAFASADVTSRYVTSNTEP